MRWPLKRRPADPAVVAAKEQERVAAAERQRRERAAREVRRLHAATRRRQVAGQLADTALSWSLNVWLEGAMWFCLAGGLAVDYVGSYADLAATFGAFGYGGWVRWIMPLGIDLPVTASVIGQLLAGRWRCGWWVRVRLGILTAVTAPLTLVGNALRGAIDANGHFVSSFHVTLWMDLAAFAVPGLGVVLIGWVASMMQGERAELTRRRLEGEAEGADQGATASSEPASDQQDEEAVATPTATAGTGDHNVADRSGSDNGHGPATRRPSTADDLGPQPGMTGHDPETDTRPADDRGDDRPAAGVMTAEEARAAVVRMVRQAHRSGRKVTGAEVQRVTGRKARQARRLLALATAAIQDNTPARRPRDMPSFHGAAEPAAAALVHGEGA